jgi:peptidoglycan DL-endopeptidase LytF
MLFTSYKLEDDGTIILYLEKTYTEFSSELGEMSDQKKSSLRQSIRSYVETNIPNVKLKTAKVMLGALLVATIPLVGNQSEAKASSSVTQTVKYNVQAGDTLFKIATAHSTSIATLKQYNSLTTDMIYVGQTLEIPNTQQTTGSYVVVPGDTLFLLSQKFNTTINTLKQINNLQSDALYVGQHLELPRSNSIDSNNTYSVKSGDTLAVIANKYGVSVNDLMNINQLNNDKIFIGQTLKIPETSLEKTNPTTYIVQAGDTLGKIATTNGITIDEIKQMNDLTSDMIYPGQALNVKALGEQPQVPSDSDQLPTESNGLAVHMLELNLQSLGYIQENHVDQRFDSYTAEGVMKFQADYSLTVDGIAGPQTLQEVENAMVKNAIVTDSINYTGVPYVWGGETPEGFDCSGFIYYMFSKHGVDTSRTTSGMLYQQGKSIEQNQLQQGDLVFFGVNKPGVVSHVGFYIGDNQFISATSSKGIWVYTMDNSYWKQYYMGAKRVY